MDYNLPELKFNLEVIQKFIQSNILLYCVVFVFILKVFLIAVSVNFPYNIFFADITKATLENLANQTRTENGLNVLVDNPVLDKAAQLKAEDMVKNQYFAHTSPTGINPWFWFSQAGYKYKYAGENLAVGYFDSIEVYNAWLNSPSHKENLLNPNYKEFGTAVVKGFGGGNSVIVVQLFGSQQPQKVVTQKTTTPKQAIKQPETKPVEPANPPASAQSSVVAKEVLSQSIEAKFEPARDNVINNIYSRAQNYLIYNREEFLENIVYGVTLIVIGAMLLLIFFSLDFKIEKQLVFRSILLIGVVGCTLLIDRSVILSVFPSHILI